MRDHEWFYFAVCVFVVSLLASTVEEVEVDVEAVEDADHERLSVQHMQC